MARIDVARTRRVLVRLHSLLCGAAKPSEEAPGDEMSYLLHELFACLGPEEYPVPHALVRGVKRVQAIQRQYATGKLPSAKEGQEVLADMGALVDGLRALALASPVNLEPKSVELLLDPERASGYTNRDSLFVVLLGVERGGFREAVWADTGLPCPEWVLEVFDQELQAAAEDAP